MSPPEPVNPRMCIRAARTPGTPCAVHTSRGVCRFHPEIPNLNEQRAPSSEGLRPHSLGLLGLQTRPQACRQPARPSPVACTCSCDPHPSHPPACPHHPQVAPSPFSPAAQQPITSSPAPAILIKVPRAPVGQGRPQVLSPPKHQMHPLLFAPYHHHIVIPACSASSASSILTRSCFFSSVSDNHKSFLSQPLLSFVVVIVGGVELRRSERKEALLRLDAAGWSPGSRYHLPPQIAEPYRPHRPHRPHRPRTTVHGPPPAPPTRPSPKAPPRLINSSQPGIIHTRVDVHSTSHTPLTHHSLITALLCHSHLYQHSRVSPTHTTQDTGHTHQIFSFGP